MKILFPILILVFSTSLLSGQGKYFTKKGNISFNSDTPMEKIEAKNQTATFVLDTKSGALQLAVLIKAFQFEKALMQEHFNENYMESDKFPKAKFKGKITNLEDIDLESDGTYTATISGDLTIHGVSNKITVPGTFIVENDKIIGTTSFEIAVADYDIEIPKLVRENIAKEVSVSVSVDLEKLNK